ncbi:signal peptidase I, partial [Streptococcus gallolyticus]
NTSIGAVSDEQIVGRLVFKVWPLSEMGIIE